MKKILLGSLLATSLVMAENIKYEKSNQFITHTKFGYVSTQGNTNTKTYILDSKIKKGFDKHLFALSFDGQYAEDSNVETKNKYLIELTYDYELTDTLAFKYLFGYKEDKFSGYSYQLYTGPGISYKAIKLPKHHLSIDSVLLYSKDKFENIDYDVDGNIVSYPNSNDTVITRVVAGDTDNYTSFRFKAVYEWQIAEDLKFTEDTSYRTEINDMKNYFIYSKTAFSSKISDIFSAGISYKVDYTNLEADGKKPIDKTLTANLIVDY